MSMTDKRNRKDEPWFAVPIIPLLLFLGAAAFGLVNLLIALFLGD